jgi:hypothetical protein
MKNVKCEELYDHSLCLHSHILPKMGTDSYLELVCGKDTKRILMPFSEAGSQKSVVSIATGCQSTVAEQSKVCTVSARLEAGTVGSNRTQDMDVQCLCVCVFLCLCTGRGRATS